MIRTATFFDFIFNNARENAVIIMNERGTIMMVNKAFTNAYGYTNEDVTDKNFEVLFTDIDRKEGKPQSEIESAIAQGNCSDNNFLLHKNGKTIWTTGESIFARDVEGTGYLLKVIHNIHTQKLLEKFLLESNEFIDSIFTSVTDIGLVVIDTRMRIKKINEAFYRMFKMPDISFEDKRLSDIDHPFWENDETQHTLRQMIVTNDYFRNKNIAVSTGMGRMTYNIDTKLIDGYTGGDKKILILVNNISDKKIVSSL